DFSEDEKKKQMSLSSSVIPVIFDNHKLNIIDTPGNDDYIYETIGITKLIKGAVLVIDASKGVQIGTVKTFNLLKKRGVPIFIFINKMDKENVDFNSLLAEIQEKLDNKKCFPFSYPIGRKENFDGFVNLVDLKARKYNGKSCEDDIIYDDKKQIVFQLHNRLCEAVATTNDEMLEHFFSGIPLTKEEIKSGLRTGVLSGELYPVLVGSAMKDIGINTLLNMMIDYLPSPIDLKPIKATDSKNEIVEIKTDEKERTSIQIFKNHFNPYQGNISIFKVQSGTVKFGDELYCPNNQKTYKMTSLFSICADKLKPTTSISAGDIGAATKLDDVKLSYTLSDPLNPITFSLIKYPTPVYFRRIIPATKKDLDKLFPAVSRLALENPTISIEKQETPDQILLGGLSTTHLNYVLEKLEGEYAIDFETQQPKISYREAITSASEAEGRYIKQTGGSGYYGVVTMRFQPSDKTEFCSKVFGGHVDKSYFPAVEKGFLEALKEGGLIHAPVINVKATLLDGKQHSVDSNEMAFKNAAILAFREAYKNCNPVLLEPFSRIVINIPIDYLGPVLSDLTKKRARILSTEETNGNTIDITAITPESEIIDYANELKSFSKGTGFFNTSFFGYEELPKVLAEKVMQENK
ncbi:MAG: elongation factor G, partial [Bacilli bacterium]